ncbi:MAG TPA: uroporphyrinogen decarboxylase [Enteractinococcus helveticum]|uniref:Uroporphyrinogen decarboxylase n=1 Tax=Enteractinococcus helveticum TaxID=1837282 RepID=A0A921K751_9MICC|nr:uroporphyrinogen decarboxylase [Enteractinococcus helveticum]HJF14375.1 uroporphyrinogen decarboxylase [Enteractinococcus helveticum]
MTKAFSQSPALPATHPLITDDAERSTAESALIKGYRGQQGHRRPVWFMRQAGRSLPEYRKLREGTTMLESCLIPDMASEITLQPVRRHDVDAAIFFSDIVIPLKLAGIGVEIQPGVGPVLDAPIRSGEDINNLPELTDDIFAPITEAVKLTVAELGPRPLIGFAGAPYTVAAYMVEGRPSRDHLGPRTMMHNDPESWDRLMAWAAEASGRFLRAQIMAGASAAQLFDSWAGSLSRANYETGVMPYSKQAIEHISDLTGPTGVPLVHFGTGTSEILDLMRDTGASVVGVDYRLRLDEANRRLANTPGPDGRTTVPLQGNIDPALLAADWSVLEAHVRDVITQGAQAPGHVLNLGHGVPPTTDPTVLTRLVEFIHSIDY